MVSLCLGLATKFYIYYKKNAVSLCLGLATKFYILLKNMVSLCPGLATVCRGKTASHWSTDMISFGWRPRTETCYGQRRKSSS
jgi:hypothetical protein